MTTPSDLVLEIPCPCCDGRGWEWYSHERCDVCDGAGYMPTDLGEKVLALMRHNFRPMLEDAQE
jgi:RecJ-like exonuclease